jgi:uncharacterized membrane protein
MAILITIMVLELDVPDGADWKALLGTLPEFATYALSFVFLGIYWNHHHHLMQVVERVSGTVLWANLHLMFWLSLVPLATHWLEEEGPAPIPMAMYGGVLLLVTVGYSVLVRTLLACQPSSILAADLGDRTRRNLSLAVYAAAIPLGFVNPLLATALYVGAVLMWLIPDRHIEARLAGKLADVQAAPSVPTGPG